MDAHPNGIQPLGTKMLQTRKIVLENLGPQWPDGTGVSISWTDTLCELWWRLEIDKRREKNDTQRTFQEIIAGVISVRKGSRTVNVECEFTTLSTEMLPLWAAIICFEM
jgi:hypothetical protein